MMRMLATSRPYEESEDMYMRSEGVMLVTYTGAPLELVKAPRKEALCKKRLRGSHDGQTSVLTTVTADEPIGSPEVE